MQEQAQYVSVNVDTFAFGDAKSTARHNAREEVRASRIREGAEPGNDCYVWVAGMEHFEALEEGEYTVISKDGEDYYRAQKTRATSAMMAKRIAQCHAQHESDYVMSKGKRRPRNSKGFLEGIMQIGRDGHGFQDGKAALIERGVKAIQEMMDTVDGNLVYISYHGDEANPHLHFVFENWDYEQHQSLRKHKFSKTLLRSWQDIVATHFKDLGYERGEGGSKAKHLSVERFKAQVRAKNEQVQELEIKKQDLETETQNLSLKVEKLKKTARTIVKQLSMRVDAYLKSLKIKKQTQDLQERIEAVELVVDEISSSDKELQDAINKAQGIVLKAQKILEYQDVDR